MTRSKIIEEKTMNFNPAIEWVRGLLVVCLFNLAIVSCTPVNPPPPQDDGPQFVINSPPEGASVSGAVFFSVQPFNASEVQRVSFTANGTELTVDAPGEDSFKVFLIPRDFPDGELTLSATVTGKDGSQSQKSIKVNVIGNPPSTATITKDGALLGTQEEGGAISTLTIPGGVAEGASVRFEARTKAEVKADTGVDYDALGVTFLGAQEISSTQALNAPLAVSSGGFAPMVQPNQVVVNYTIASDGDGDGIGELMVINTASVAPNGDVISDPVPQVQLGAATVTDSTGTQTLRSLQTGTISGPPGSRIELEVVGFHTASAFGNLAIFEAPDGSITEQPGMVFLNDDGSQTFVTILPLINPGPAKLTLRNVSTGASTSEISLNIEPLTPINTPPVETVMNTLILAREAITQVQNDIQQVGESAPPELSALLTSIAELEAFISSNQDSADPELQKAFNDLATLFVNAGISDLLQRGLNDLDSEGLTASGLCDPSLMSVYRDIFTGAGLVGGALLTVAVGIAGVVASGVTVPLLVVAFGGLSFGVSVAWIGGAGIGFLSLAFLGLVCPPPDCDSPGAPPSSGGSATEGIRAQQLPPPPAITGMGSAVPPGGDSCGSAVGGDPAANLRTSSSLRSLQNQLAGTTNLFGDLAGRFVVKVFFGGGNSVPFTGVSDSSGYFYIPLIPAGQPFEAIAIDTLTCETRSFEGTGPEVGESTYMFFDFLSEGESGAKVIGYDTNTQGVHDGVDIYFFEGKAGDVINLAWFSEEGHGDGTSFQISDPNGVPMRSGLVSGGGHYFETGLLPEIELELDGLYSFTLDGSETSGNYTLGLTKIKSPTPLDVTVPLVGELTTLGERRFYSFAGNVDDVVDVTLSHEASSSLNTEVLMREPLVTVPFFKQPVSLRLETTDTRRSSSVSPRTLTVGGDYVLEVGHDNPFDEVLQEYLGTYQVDISKTP
jgi:hypothetical protein